MAEGSFKDPSKDMLLRSIHHGLCYLSSSAKQAGFSTDLIELRLCAGWEEFREKVKREPIDVAAVTMMSPDHENAMRCIEIIKAARQETVVVVGGIHPTIMPEKLASSKGVDHVVRGEGEVTFVKLLKTLEEGGTPEKILQGETFSFDSLPYIDRYLFDGLESPWDFFLPMPFFTIMAGRGCSYNCKFCAPASKMVHGKGARRRSVKSVIDELRLLKGKYGMKSFLFHDDCFTENSEWVSEFCRTYKAEGFTQEFICQSRADIICKNPGMMKELARVGLRMALIGFESGNDRVLKFIGKGVTVKQNLDAAKICRANGIRIFANHMYGLPTETNEEAWDTAKMIRKIRPYRASAAFFTPHPGSYLYDYCKANDLSLIDDHDDMHRFPEVDKAKIRGVDYDFMRRAASESKKLPFEVRVQMRIDRLFPNRRNRRFLRSFREFQKSHPGMHAMDILSTMKAKCSHA